MTNLTSKKAEIPPSNKTKKPLTHKKLQKTIEQYFNECDTTTKEIYVKSSGTIERISSPSPYTLEGLSLATGISREAILNYELYETNQKRIKIINQAKLRIQENIINRALDGESNATMTTFILKNNFGYKDKAEQQATAKDGEASLNTIHVKIIRNKEDLSNE